MVRPWNWTQVGGGNMFAWVKLVEFTDVFSRGAFPKSAEWRQSCAEVEQAISATDWPHGSGSFTIYPERAIRNAVGNGVVPIKYPCIEMLKALGWEVERLPEIVDGVLGTGDLDALRGSVAFEWETGNISSSHRAINKLLMGLKFGGIKGAILVVPSDRMKLWLTDRVGNIGELRPYFRLWDDAKLYNDEGVLRIYVVEHDAESFDVPRIPKGQDGNALRATARRVSSAALKRRRGRR